MINQCGWSFNVVVGWSYCIKSMKMLWRILQIHPWKMVEKNPFKSFEDIGSQQLLVDQLLWSLSSRRCARVWIASSNGAVWAENWSSCTQAVQACRFLWWCFILQSIFPTKFNSKWKPLKSYKRAPRGRKGSSSNGELLNFGGVYEQTFSGPCIKEILGWYFEMVGLSISM